MLEETKKEVREIKSVEATMKWDMQREDQREELLEARDREDEIRIWRWKQNEGLKAIVEERKQQEMQVDLEESKGFQEFKREHKAHLSEQEKRYVHEVYVQDKEDASWRVEVAQAAQEREKFVVVERVEDVQEQRALREALTAQAKTEEEAERVHQQTLEMAKMISDLQREKNKVLQSLAYTRSAARARTGCRGQT